MKSQILYSLVLIILGICMFIYGGYDDSPGGQLLGFVAVIFGVVRIVRAVRNKGVKQVGE